MMIGLNSYSKLLKHKIFFLYACSILIFTHAPLASTWYQLEVIFFAQPKDTITYKTNKRYDLPSLDPLNTKILPIENEYDENILSGNLIRHLNKLRGANYKTIGYAKSNIELEEFNSNKIVFTNQNDIIEAVTSNNFNNLNYVSRTYFANSDINPLLVLVKLRPNNTTSLHTTIHYVHTYLNQDIEIFEKRRVAAGEINYFDNENNGILILLTHIDPPAIEEENINALQEQI